MQIYKIKVKWILFTLCFKALLLVFKNERAKNRFLQIAFKALS
nr:MAG TPA: hypothetical protein [Caudoviricetes sp.]